MIFSIIYFTGICAVMILAWRIIWWQEVKYEKNNKIIVDNCDTFDTIIINNKPVISYNNTLVAKIKDIDDV